MALLQSLPTNILYVVEARDIGFVMIDPSITNMLEAETSFQTSLDFRQGYVLEHILESLYYNSLC